MSDGGVLPAPAAADPTFGQVCLAAAQFSADCCGIELAVTANAAEGIAASFVLAPSADAPAALRRVFRLPDDLPDIVVSTATLSLQRCCCSKPCVVGLECPTLPAFTDSVARWVRACQGFCASDIFASGGAAAGGREAQAAAFQQMLRRADALHGANPFLVGATLTIIDLAVSMLIVGAAATIDGAPAVDRAPLRFHGPVFQHCCAVLTSARRATDGKGSLLEARSACPASAAILHHLHRCLHASPSNSSGLTAGKDVVHPVVPTKQKMLNGLPAVAYVAGLAILFFVMTGMESTGPAALKTMKADLRTSTIGITAALQMKEVGKILVAPVVAHFTVGPLWTKVVVSIAACLVWGAGMIVMGTSPTVIGVGAGSLISGLGFGVIFVIYSPLIVSLLPRAAMYILPTYTASLFASGLFGVVVAYGIAGATLNQWRLNYCLAPVILLPPLIVFMVGALRISQATPPAPGVDADALPDDPAKERHTGSNDTAASDDAEVPPQPAEQQHAEDGSETYRVANSPPHVAVRSPETAPEQFSTSYHGDAQDEATRSGGGEGKAAARGGYMAIVRLLLRHPFVLSTVVVHCGQTFCIASFATLLAYYIEERLRVSQGTASYVMAATVPFMVAGVVLGGLWARRQHYGLVSLLNMTRIFSFISSCMMPVFLIDSLLPFVIVLLAVMFIISLKGGPQTALLSNSCEYIAVCRVQQDAAAAARCSPSSAGSGGGSPRPNGLARQQLLSLGDDARRLSDRYISTLSSIVTVLIRVFGTIPGPIVLSVLVDESGWAIQFPFLLVGLASCSVMTVGAFAAYHLCPKDADAVVARFHVECVDREMKEIFRK